MCLCVCGWGVGGWGGVWGGGGGGGGVHHQKTKQGSNDHVTGPNFTDEKWFGRGIGIAIRKQDRDLKEKLDKALEKIIASGEHNRIAKQYFSHDIMQ